MNRNAILITSVAVGIFSYAVRPQWETAVFAALAVGTIGGMLEMRSAQDWIAGDGKDGK